MRKRSSKQRGSKRDRWRIWVAGILFTLAALLLAMVPIRTYLLAQFQDEHVEALSHLTLSEVKENEQQEAEFDFSKVEPISLQSVINAQMDTTKFPTVGAIAIPTVSLNLPIYKGVSNSVLLAGAGTMKPTQKMGKGNYSLASHHYRDERLLFSPIIRMKVGDKIYITDLEYVYEYATTSVDLISPTRMDVLDDVDDRTEVTLITCDDAQATNRYCIKGEFVSKTAIRDISDEVRNAFSIEFSTV